MSSQLTAVLIIYLLVKGIDTIISIVNLRHLAVYGHYVPKGFAGVVDQETLTRMRDYTLAQGRVELAGTILDIFVTLIFIFGPLLNSYNNWIAGLGLSPLMSGILFFLLLSYLSLVIHIPFSLYNTFYLEEKFGFNTQTPLLWLTDLIKELLLSTVLYTIVLWAALRLIDAFPESWWLLVWGFMLFFKLFILYVSPYVIEPLFNKFTPIADKNLETKIKELLAQAGLTVSRVFTMDGSRRSRHGNAYFSGIGRTKRIVIFDTLLEKSRDDEILAILAHEAGHWKKKHIIKRLVIMECVSLVTIYAAFLLVNSNLPAEIFGLEQATLWARLLLVGFLASLAFFPFKPLSTYFSRKQEWEADDFAVKLTGQPRALARALVRLGKDNLSNLHPHPWYVALHYSHPPLPQRVARLYNQ